ncbi:MAG: NAD(P)H-hydrate dehydratase [Acetobacteraceae bacterium]|nr:NAD(P)H-hydrate dehydratase [Acetobacteraceae bacterium]
MPSRACAELALALDAALLRRMPLPRHREDADKDERGRVLIAGGHREIPGAVLLSAVGALRAGAGKLQVATVEEVAVALAVALPEARVFGLPAGPGGDLSPRASPRLAQLAARVDALVLGPGMLDGDAASALAEALFGAAPGCALVLDAAALHGLGALAAEARSMAGRLVLTPHAGEMATLLAVPRAEVLADPLAAGRRAAAMLQAVTVVKGSPSFVVTPQREAWRSDLGDVGLATSGSGDTLAGILGGLLARGAAPLTATLWAVFLHAEAGARLARRLGPVGYLARELLAEVPVILREMAEAG